MSHFETSFLRFFHELAENNHKGWFDHNRKWYEQSVKKPFRDFIQEVIKRIRIYEPNLMVEPKHVVFRINRDIRFARDKTPYKTHVAANIAKGGRKTEEPGFYIHFGKDVAIIGGGIYSPGTQRLQLVRELISEELDSFQSIVHNSDFKGCWGEIQGNQNKRIPKAFRPVYEKEPLIANKQFYVYRELDPEIVLNPELLNEIMRYYKALKPFNDFMNQAFDEKPDEP